MIENTSLLFKAIHSRGIFFLSISLFCLGTSQGQLAYQDISQDVLSSPISHGQITNVGLGPGISFVDYNSDGWDDISIPASGTEDFQFLKNVGGTFEIDPLPISSNGKQARQISWVDFDNDGDLDFFATGEQGDLWFYEHLDSGNYEDITNASGFITSSVEYWGNSWGDIDNDGFLDVFISVRDNAQIDYNYLYKNNGDGTFSDITASAQLSNVGYITFCSSFFDYDKDGDQDIYLANDKDETPNILYRNNGDSTFTDVSIESGTDLYMSAMSTTIDDYDNDGWLDIYITNFYPPFIDGATIGNALLHNNADGTFTNVALESNTRFDSIGWGAVFTDADGDMDKDLYVSGQPDGTGGLLPSAFYENDDLQSFELREDIGFGNNSFRSFGNAIGDVENDGQADIIVINTNNEPINIWNNQQQTSNHWLKIKLEGTTSNRMGVGALLEIKVGDIYQYNYTLCGEGYSSQNSQSEFFGVGDNTEIDHLKIIWPSGQEELINNLEVDQSIVVREGEGIVLSVEKTLENDALFALFPNPSSTHITLYYRTQTEAFATIFNVQGQYISKQALSREKENYRFDISHLANGIYFLEVRDKESIIRKKFIKID